MLEFKKHKTFVRGVIGNQTRRNFEGRLEVKFKVGIWTLGMMEICSMM